MWCGWCWSTGLSNILGQCSIFSQQLDSVQWILLWMFMIHIGCSLFLVTLVPHGTSLCNVACNCTEHITDPMDKICNVQTDTQIFVVNILSLWIQNVPKKPPLFLLDIQSKQLSSLAFTVAFCHESGSMKPETQAAHVAWLWMSSNVSWPECNRCV